MTFIIDEYNKSPHTTLTRLLKKSRVSTKTKYLSPNDVDGSLYLENLVVNELMKENLLTEMQVDYDVKGRVRVLNELSTFDKLKPQLLPGKWEVVGKSNGLNRLKQDKN